MNARGKQGILRGAAPVEKDEEQFRNSRASQLYQDVTKLGKIQSTLSEKDGLIQRLRDTNEELTQQLGVLSHRLDDLMVKVRQKQIQDEKLQ